MSENPGIVSLGGYAYQIKIFISLLPHIKEGDTIEFETLDDITVSENNIDSKSEYFCTTQLDEKNNLFTAIQVKNAKISTTSIKKIWYNWLLAYHEHKNLCNFELRYDKSKNTSFDLYSISLNELFNAISSSTSKKNSLETKVKQIYDNKKIFESDFNYIKSNSKSIAIENIDEQIYNDYKSLFHWTNKSDELYKLRLEELCKKIQSIVLNSVENKTPYICDYSDFYNIIELISNRVTSDAYIPDYALFTKTINLILENKNIINSREFRQLSACKISENSIRLYLTNQLYYNDYRYRSLRNLRADKIDNTEITAHENFCNVLEILKHNNTDTPYNRLNSTTSENNSHAPDDQIRKGVCIHLTEEEVENDKKITWSDDND